MRRGRFGRYPATSARAIQVVPFSRDASTDKTGRDHELVANVSDGGRDCRRQNNNNRLDTPGIQKWINDTIR